MTRGKKNLRFSANTAARDQSRLLVNVNEMLYTLSVNCWN